MKELDRNSFIFYASFWEAIKEVPRDVQGEVLTAIIEYGLYGVTTEQLKPIAKAMFTLIKPQLDANHKRYLNGKRGGAPPGNTNAAKTTEEQPKNNQKQPNENDNGNYNANLNSNVNDNPPAHTALAHVPTKQAVREYFYQVSTDKALAEKQHLSFYLKWDGLGWEDKGSPLKKWTSYADKFIINWDKNEKESKPKRTLI
jgi:hypothetical protein